MDFNFTEEQDMVRDGLSRLVREQYGTETRREVIATEAGWPILADSRSGLDESVTTPEDHCALCCERAMDCVLIPCGHQICCTECGHQIKCCPVCKVNCSVLRIFRQ